MGFRAPIHDGIWTLRLHVVHVHAHVVIPPPQAAACPATQPYSPMMRGKLLCPAPMRMPYLHVLRQRMSSGPPPQARMLMLHPHVLPQHMPSGPFSQARMLMLHPHVLHQRMFVRSSTAGARSQASSACASSAHVDGSLAAAFCLSSHVTMDLAVVRQMASALTFQLNPQATLPRGCTIPMSANCRWPASVRVSWEPLAAFS